MDLGRGVVTGCYHQLVDGPVVSMERNIASQVSADFVYQLLLIGTHREYRLLRGKGHVFRELV